MSYYYNNENQEDPDDYDLTEGQEQIEIEEQFDKYCDHVKDVHEEMIEYAQNSGLMEFSDYFDLMNLIEKGEYEFTTREKQIYLRSNSSRYAFANRSTYDNCFIPDPIDMTDLHLFDTFNLDTETIPKPKTPPKPKKVLKEIKHSPTKFTGWKKQNVKIGTIYDIQDNQKQDIKVNNKFKLNKSRPTNNRNIPKGKYIPPSLR